MNFTIICSATPTRRCELASEPTSAATVIVRGQVWKNRETGYEVTVSGFTEYTAGWFVAVEENQGLLPESRFLAEYELVRWIVADDAASSEESSKTLDELLAEGREVPDVPVRPGPKSAAATKVLGRRYKHGYATFYTVDGKGVERLMADTYNAESTARVAAALEAEVKDAR